ncbi:MAG: hypothetical protein IJK32_10375 [Bacteroidales bacterium]|nr:hypothetical protein [Bacteroidales bacterium]
MVPNLTGDCSSTSRCSLSGF